MRQETIVIDGPRDFELDRDRLHPLTFTVTWPDAAMAPRIVMVIGGCGGQAETAEGRHRNAREHIVAQTGLAAISVDYHAQQNCPFSGGGRQRPLGRLCRLSLHRPGLPLQPAAAPALCARRGLRPVRRWTRARRCGGRSPAGARLT